MTEKFTFIEKKMVCGVTFSISKRSVFEYYGEWADVGYAVTDGKKTIIFFGWPTNSALIKMFGLVVDKPASFGEYWIMDKSKYQIYKSIRKPIAPPTRVMRHKKMYSRKIKFGDRYES
jgi:hypothetical protein